jgi:acyl-CoA thioesterase FadM
MYPFPRLIKEMLIARKQPKLPFEGVHVSHHICWPWDIDMFGEMNNGRILTVFDLGRFPLALRVGLFDLLRRKKWALTMAGASVRYRKRILPFRKYEMRSSCVGRDARFFYLHQSMWEGDTCCASVLYRSAVLERGKIVPTDRVATELHAPDWNPELPAWVQAWIDADNTRAWPPEH